MVGQPLALQEMKVARLIEADLALPAEAQPRHSRPVARIAATIASALSGSTASGRCPDRPSRMARSVAWPLPVSASDP
jgi:hypothetical protein